ncbi:hypothetical protein WJX81_005422 [Elliptochloris bilobata]|uniref:Uncharacterized protein n=1 Tax=Elliptochloris bilobata TaxID=381761 RepID=A0AAW1S7Q9_9CHLO
MLVRPDVSYRRAPVRSRRLAARAAADREVARRPELRNLPPAPPTFSPPPPPPPPPPPVEEAGPNGPRRAVLLGLLLGGSSLWWKYINSQMPEMYRDKAGVHYMVTRGGNKVAVTVDKQGRAYFVDKAGDLYYDSGNQKIGFYVVDTQDQIFNVYLGSDGEPRRVKVGDLRDLGTVRVTDLGGIPVSNLQSASRARRRSAITAFPDPDAGGVVLPPNTPFTQGPDGKVAPPRMLEEGGVVLQEKRGWWPFGKPKDSGGPLQAGNE